MGNYLVLINHKVSRVEEVVEDLKGQNAAMQIKLAGVELLL